MHGIFPSHMLGGPWRFEDCLFLIHTLFDLYLSVEAEAAWYVYPAFSSAVPFAFGT